MLDLTNNQFGDAGLTMIFREGLSNGCRIRDLAYGGGSKLKKHGKIESFRVIQTFTHIKKLDLSLLTITSKEENSALTELLSANLTLEDIKLPKIQIENNELEAACYEIFGAVIQHRTLIYANLSFF